MTDTGSPKRNPLKVVLPLVLILGAGFVGWKVWPAKQAQAAEPTVFHGNVDVRDVTLAFRAGGRVESVLKTEGDHVKPGEVVARLDAGPSRVALEQARSAVAVARAQLKRAEAGSRREEVAEAEALLAERKAASERADDTLARLERLTQSGAVAQQSLVEAQSSAAQTHAAITAAQATVTKLKNGTRLEDLAVSRAQLAQAEAAVSTAELNLTDTELKASLSGIVVTRAIEPGAIVGVGSPALVVAFDDPVWIRAFAAERDLGRVAPGTRVDVYTDARPNQPYQGNVGYVASQAEFTPKSVETAELRTSLVYRFRVIVSVHDGGLRQGMPVSVRLHAGDEQKPKEAPQLEASQQ